tara:strand:+ start:1095 stop:1979 length:885 start_codon:yes stop_codon:yes gene_type:complete
LKLFEKKLSEEGKIFLSVVIPTYERPNDLAICLNSLSEDIQLGTPSYEIIASDDSKSEDSRRMVESKFPNVYWGKGKQNGPAGNRNAGVERAKGEWIVFLDDDCIAQKGYLLAYAKAIESNPDVLVFEGRIFADRPRRTWEEGCPENEQGGMLWTSNLCVNRHLFIEMGGLDERFHIAYEDVDFALRVKKRGLNSIFVKEAAVCHPWRDLGSLKNWKSSGYQYEELLNFLNKHPKEYINHSPKVFFRHFIRGITKDIVTGIIQFRGRGTFFKIIRTYRSLLTAIYVYRWKKSFS